MYWPWFVGGLIGPPFARLLVHWLPDYFASGVAFFLVFALAASVVSRQSRAGSGALTRNLAASAAGGVVNALLAYLFTCGFES